MTAINEAALRHTWATVATATWDAIDATVASPRAYVHQEQGGWDSRIAPTDRTLAASARTTHLAHRALAFVDRRLYGANRDTQRDVRAQIGGAGRTSDGDI